MIIQNEHTILHDNLWWYMIYYIYNYIKPMITRTTIESLSEWWIMCLSTTFRNLYVYEWRTKLLSTRNGHGQSGWSLYRLWRFFRTNLNIPSPLPTTSVSCKFCPLLLYMEVSWTEGTKYHPCYVCFSIIWVKQLKKTTQITIGAINHSRIGGLLLF